jgi:hypothetical protein
MSDTPIPPWDQNTEGGTCDHDYTYQGVVYVVGSYPLPGSGAKPVTYYESFFCRRCLDRRFVILPGEHNNYQPVLYGATPKP